MKNTEEASKKQSKTANVSGMLGKIRRKQSYRGEVEHKCSMPPPEDIVVRYIDSGCCVYIRRKFRRYLTVSDTNPRGSSYLRSSAAIRQEKAHHLQHHYYMIHPFSDGRAYWEFFMTFVLFSLLAIIPFEISTLTAVWYTKIPKFCLDIFCCIDICITFASGYYEHNTKKIILNPKQVARRYLRGYFIIDSLSSMPVELGMTIFGKDTQLWYIKLLTCLKLMRLTTFIKYLNRLRDRRGYSIYKFKVFKLITTYLIALLWATSLVYLIARTSKNSWLPPEVEGNTFRGLLTSCFKALYNILLVGYGYRKTTEITDMIFSLICMAIGVVLQVFIYAEILQILNKNLSAKNKYQHMVHQLHEYIRYKLLPESMRKRILLYFNFRFERKYYKEAEILGTLSENLRQDITLHTCQSLVESVDFFRDLPLSLLVRIVKGMKSEIYLTNDVIVRAGISGDSMYFIASGTTAVYTYSGKEICHLADGGHFGEIALVMENEKRIASVVAVECCELFNLSRKDFRKAIAPYPELYERIYEFAQNRLQRTMKYMHDEFVRKARADAEDSENPEENPEENQEELGSTSTLPKFHIL